MESAGSPTALRCAGQKLLLPHKILATGHLQSRRQIAHHTISTHGQIVVALKCDVYLYSLRHPARLFLAPAPPPSAMSTMASNRTMYTTISVPGRPVGGHPRAQYSAYQNIATLFWAASLTPMIQEHGGCLLLSCLSAGCHNLPCLTATQP